MSHTQSHICGLTWEKQANSTKSAVAAFTCFANLSGGFILEPLKKVSSTKSAVAAFTCFGNLGGGVEDRIVDKLMFVINNITINILFLVSHINASRDPQRLHLLVDS